MWPQALFKQVDLYLGDRCVSTSTNTHAYRAYFETALSYPSFVKNELLDATEHWTGSAVSSTKNQFDSIIPLHLDMCNQGKLILNGIPIKIRLLRNEDRFCIIKGATDTNTYKITVEKVSLFLRTVAPSPALLLAHAWPFLPVFGPYLTRRVWVKTFNLSKGLTDTTISNVFLGSLPNRVILGLVDSSAFNGVDTKNSFHFSPFKLNHISLLNDGKQIPAVAYEPDFVGDVYRREYLGLLQTLLGDYLKQDSIGISLADFKDGSTFFGFTLPSVMDGASEESVPPKKTGYINLRLRFAEALTTNVTVVVYGEFDNTIEIDSARNVFTDFAS